MSAQPPPECIEVGLRSHAAPPLSDLRARVRDMLANVSPDCVDDVQLLVTEMVSNSYEHGRRPLSARLRRLRRERLIRLEVDDANPTGLPVVGSSRLGSTRGRGMVLVDRLADRWGTAVRCWGKTLRPGRSPGCPRC